MAPTKSSLGRLLRQQREAAGLSTRDLAEEIGVSHGYIALIEGGDRSPLPDTLRKLARVLHVPVEDLFALSGHVINDGLPDFGTYLRAKFELSDKDIRQLKAQFDELLEQKKSKKGGRGGKRTR